MALALAFKRVFDWHIGRLERTDLADGVYLEAQQPAEELAAQAAE